MLYLLTAAEVAKKLNCSASLVYGLFKRGRLPFVRIGMGGQGGIRVREEDLELFIEQNRVVEQTPAPPRSVTLKHLRL